MIRNNSSGQNKCWNKFKKKNHECDCVLGGNLRENPVNGLAGEGVTIVSQQIFPVQQEIMIHIKLPEFAIQHVKMFVTKELAHLVDIVVLV